MLYIYTSAYKCTNFSSGIILIHSDSMSNGLKSSIIQSTHNILKHASCIIRVRIFCFNRPITVPLQCLWRDSVTLISKFCYLLCRLLLGVTPFLLQLIRDLHTGTTARVRTPQGMSDVFYTTSGVRQGCVRFSLVEVVTGKRDLTHFSVRFSVLSCVMGTTVWGLWFWLVWHFSTRFLCPVLIPGL